MTDLREAIARAIDPAAFLSVEGLTQIEAGHIAMCRAAALTKAVDALAAIEASGYVVVPAQPTNEMIGAVARIPQPYHSTTTWHGDDIYRTFLRARPAVERSADDAAG